MKPESNTDRVESRAFWAALAFFALGLLVLGGRLYSGDAEAYFTVGFQFSLGRLPAISERLVGYGVRGTAGLFYAKFGLGFSLILIPLIWITLMLAAVMGASLTGPVLYTSAHLIGPIMGGAGVYLFHTLQHRLGFTRCSRTVGTVFFLFGGLWLVYSRFLFSELFAGVLVLTVLHGLLEETSTGDWLVGAASAFLVLTRSEMVLFAGPVILVRLLRHRRLVPHVVSFVLGASVFGWYNWLRFGNPLYTGMGHSAVETFSTPIVLGFYGQFFAPGNGLFVYAPFLVVPVSVSLIVLVRTKLYDDGRILAVGVGCLFYLLLHSAWHSWMGGWSWGPRRVIPILGLIHLSVGFSWSKLSSTLRGMLWGLLPLSLLLNTAGLIGDFNEYYRGLFYERDVLFDPAYAQVVRHNLGLLRGQFSVDNIWVQLFGLGGATAVLGGILLVVILMTRNFVGGFRL